MLALLLAAVVTIGEPGNPPLPSGRGTVDYTFGVSEQLVTNQEFADFLQASGAPMPQPPDWAGFQLTRYGDQWQPLPGTGGLPVQGIDWLSAARYVNWLASDGATTEDGAYLLEGSPQARYVQQPPLRLMLQPVQPSAMQRRPGAAYWLPTGDEWAKASQNVPGLGVQAEYGELGWVGEYCIGRSCMGPSAMALAWAADGPSPVLTGAGSGAGVGLRVFAAAAGPAVLLGDVDLDQDIDSADLLGMLAGWTGALPPAKLWTSRSDLNRDGDIDSDDLLGLLAGWTGAAAAGRAVPEPGGWAAAWLAVVFFKRGRRWL